MLKLHLFGCLHLILLSVYWELLYLKMFRENWLIGHHWVNWVKNEICGISNQLKKQLLLICMQASSETVAPNPD